MSEEKITCPQCKGAGTIEVCPRCSKTHFFLYNCTNCDNKGKYCKLCRDPEYDDDGWTYQYGVRVRTKPYKHQWNSVHEYVTCEKCNGLATEFKRACGDYHCREKIYYNGTYIDSCRFKEPAHSPCPLCKGEKEVSTTLSIAWTQQQLLKKK